MTVRVVVFDVYGTLLDVQRLNEVLAAHFPGQAEQLQRLWRAKQLEYTWLRSLMGRYRDFRQVTEEAFRYAAASFGLAPGDETVRSVVDAYLRLAAFAEVPGVMEALAAEGRTLAVLSNGTHEMLETALRHAGLARYLTAILSVDEVGIYKPHPRVYALVPERLAGRVGNSRRPGASPKVLILDNTGLSSRLGQRGLLPHTVAIASLEPRSPCRQWRQSFMRLKAVQVNSHSKRALDSPRSSNCRSPMASLRCPITGSTEHCRSL